MSYTKIFAVPDPLGVHHFSDFDDALEFARSKGMSAGRILTEYLDDEGNPVNPPQDEIERRADVARQEAEYLERLNWAKIKAARENKTDAPTIAPIDILGVKAQAIKTAQDAIAEALRLSKASAPSEFVQPPELTPQDLGVPSPVPYSLFLRQPSADIDPTGQETRQSTISSKTLQGVINEAAALAPIPGLAEFIEGAFDAWGAYRLEIIVGDVSIKVYKHPNN